MLIHQRRFSFHFRRCFSFPSHRCWLAALFISFRCRCRLDADRQRFLAFRSFHFGIYDHILISGVFHFILVHADRRCFAFHFIVVDTDRRRFSFHLCIDANRQRFSFHFCTNSDFSVLEHVHTYVQRCTFENFASMRSNPDTIRSTQYSSVRATVMARRVKAEASVV